MTEEVDFPKVFELAGLRIWILAKLIKPRLAARAANWSTGGPY